MTIFEKLLSIQGELKAPKSQHNNFGNYNYRNCEDIMEAVKPLTIKNKCVLTVSDNLEIIGERYYIKATATLFDCESDSKIINTAFAREEESKKGMDGSQVTGASSSYARKYALNGLFAIDDTKDSDATNTGDNKPTSSHKQANTSAKEIDELRQTVQLKAVELTGNDSDTLKALYQKACKVDDIIHVPTEQLNPLLETIEKLLKKRKEK